MHVNIAHTLRRSAANGPGERFVIWVQGCPLACPGCWNPDTWSFERRILRSIDELVAEILDTRDIEGVTFTGGEPFAQARALTELGRRIKDAGLSIFIFTGFEISELTKSEHKMLLSITDVLVTGRYRADERAISLPWRGSTNQTLHFLTGRYNRDDIKESPEIELHLLMDGTIKVTGFPTDPAMLDPLSTEHV